jgi:hypothetical protein
MSACDSDALRQEVHAYGSEVAADFAPATGNTSLIRARVGRLRSALAERRRSAGHFLGVWVVDVGLRRLCWRLENGRALDIWLRQRPNWYRVPACVYVTAPRDSND